jgi:fumarate hydratase class II
MMPVIARDLLESVRLLAAVSRLLATRCVDGLTADTARMRAYAEASPSVVTPLNRYLGYEQAAHIVKRALTDGASIADTVRSLGFVERGEITEEQLTAALDVDGMTGR